MFRMADEKGGDGKVLRMPAAGPRQERDIQDVPEFDRLEIEHFP
jgi:inorganic pyrophosphatase